MTEQLTRDRIVDVLRKLPADAVLDDAIERLLLLRRIASADVRVECGVPVFPPRPGALVLTGEDVERLAHGSDE